MSIQFDFLPKEYHEIHLRRRRVPLLVLVVLFMFCLGTGTLLFQTQLNRRLWKTREELSHTWEQTRVRTAQFQQQQARKEQARKKISVLQPILAGYPRSWLLDSVLANVPQHVVLDRISLSLKEGSDSATSEGLGVAVNVYKSENAGQDQLVAFQKSMKGAWIDILIDARTVSATAVQDFLVDLSRNPIFEEVSLRTVEGTTEDKKDGGTTRFELVLRVRHLPNPSSIIRTQQVNRLAGESPSNLNQLAERIGTQ